MNNSISFVLVETSHSGNIGAAARAMKTMGFGCLRLVKPCEHLNSEAMVRASGADDIVKNAVVYDSLAAALSDRTLAIGSSARSRSLEWSTVDAAEAAKIIVEAGGLAGDMSGDMSGDGVGSFDSAPRALDQSTAAIVFGRERSGLSNEELELCDRRLSIPTNPDFSSLNLGSAVQVVAYELRRSMMSAASNPVETALADSMVDKQAMEHFFEHLQRVMQSTGFLDPENPRLLMRRLRRLFGRAEPRQSEMQILRGILTSVEKSLPIDNPALATRAGVEKKSKPD